MREPSRDNRRIPLPETADEPLAAGSPGPAAEPDPDLPPGPLWEPLRRLNAAFNGVACVFILAILAFTLVGVFTRYVLRDPAVWTYPVSSYLLLWVIYLATASALQNGFHVRVTFALYMLPRRAVRYIEAVAAFATSFFVAVFLWQVTRLFARSWEHGYHDTSYLHVPLWLAQAVMPVGLLLLLATALNQLVLRVRAIRGAA